MLTILRYELAVGRFQDGRDLFKSADYAEN